MRPQRLLFLLALLVTICQFTNAQFDPEDRPTQTYTTAPKNPTPTMNPKHHLGPGETYADPKNNPFKRKENIIFGPASKARFANFSTSFPGVDGDERCGTPTGKHWPRPKWANHFVEVLTPDGVVQSLGFNFDLFQELEERAGQVGELTVGRGMKFDEPRGNRTKPMAEKRWVFGADDRTEVTNTWIYPYSAVGQVGTGCTGTLIGPRHVLTAGHCVHSGKGGTWHTNLNFTLFKTPGVTGKYDKIIFDWARVFSVKGWTKHGKWDYDYALIILRTADTKQSWIPFGYNTALSAGWRLNMNGFLSDKPEGSMWRSYGPVTDTTDLAFDNEIDATPGESGSGVYLYNKAAGKRVIYGIQSNEAKACYPNFPDFWNCHTVRWNMAVRINKQRFKQICGWMDSSLC